MLYLEGTTSVTPTLLRLIFPFGKSDGRCVHALDCRIHIGNFGYITFKSIFVGFIKSLFR